MVTSGILLRKCHFFRCTELSSRPWKLLYAVGSLNYYTPQDIPLFEEFIICGWAASDDGDCKGVSIAPCVSRYNHLRDIGPPAVISRAVPGQICLDNCSRHLR